MCLNWIVLAIQSAARAALLAKLLVRLMVLRLRRLLLQIFRYELLQMIATVAESVAVAFEHGAVHLRWRKGGR